MAGDLLDGLTAQVKDRLAKLASNPVVVFGTDASGNIVNLGAAGGGLSPVSVTPNFISAAASSTTIIPIGAVNASVLILTGTGTLNTVDQPVGVPWTEPNKLAATVTLVLASASTARVYYGT